MTFDWTISVGTVVSVAWQTALAAAVIFKWGRRMYQRVMSADSLDHRLRAVEDGMATLTETLAANMQSTERMHVHNDRRLAAIEHRLGFTGPPPSDVL